MGALENLNLTQLMFTFFSFFHVVTDELMSLSPYEMRNLLHHIMSGREFSIKKCQKYQSGYNIVSNNDRVSQVSLCIFIYLNFIQFY